MAFSDVANSTEVQTPTTQAPAPAPAPQASAPATAPQAPTAQDKKKSGDGAYAKFIATGASFDAQDRANNADAYAHEGELTGKIKFIACLEDGTTVKKRTANNQSILSYNVVGYEFEALADLDVPVAPYKNTPPASWEDVNDNGETQHVSAGEHFVLNIYETVLLFSKPEVNGKVSRVKDGVNAFAVLGAKASNGSVTPFLNSTKGVNGETVAPVKEDFVIINKVKGKSADGKTLYAREIADPKYAKFAGILATKTASRGSSQKKATTPKSAQVAAAFRAYLADKKKNA